MTLSPPTSGDTSKKSLNILPLCPVVLQHIVSNISRMFGQNIIEDHQTLVRQNCLRILVSWLFHHGNRGAQALILPRHEKLNEMTAALLTQWADYNQAPSMPLLSMALMVVLDSQTAILSKTKYFENSTFAMHSFCLKHTPRQ